MFQIDANYNITIAQGDSIHISLVFGPNNEELPVQFSKGAIAIFAASKLTESRAASGVRAENTVAVPVYIPVIKKTFKIEDDNTVALDLSNAETRNIAVGEYNWDVRIVVGANYNEDEDIFCACNANEVISIFSGKRELPKMTVTGVVVSV